MRSTESLNALGGRIHGRVANADLGQQHLNLSVELLLAHPLVRIVRVGLPQLAEAKFDYAYGHGRNAPA